VRINGDDFLAAFRAHVPKRLTFITPRKPSLKPAFPAKCRRWHADFFIKRKIIRLNREVFFAILTGFSAHISYICFLYTENISTVFAISKYI